MTKMANGWRKEERGLATCDMAEVGECNETAVYVSRGGLRPRDLCERHATEQGVLIASEENDLNNPRTTV